MKFGASRLFQLQPDPYDVSQRRLFRACIFRDVKNAIELREALRGGTIDAAFIRAELLFLVASSGSSFISFTVDEVMFSVGVLLRPEFVCEKSPIGIDRLAMVLETFILLAAANRAVHQAAHNRLSTRSLHAELIYSLSPSRNISDSLITFGIAETSRDLLVGIFDDESGEKMVEIAKKIDGRPASLDELSVIADYSLIKKVYHVTEPEFNEETISDEIITRIVTKDYMA